ncbi:DUF6612 family protein [Chloroflexota bacterium]
MWRKIAAISLALVIVLTFTACKGATGGETGLPSVEEIINKVAGAQDDARTFRLDMDMTMDMVGEEDGEVYMVAMVSSSAGAVDIPNEKLMMDMDMTMEMGEMALPDEGVMEVSIVMYMIDNVMYMMTDIPEMGPMWMKYEVDMPEEILGQMDQTQYQVELLEDAVQVELVGSEVVGGVDCYVLELNPDMNQLWQLMMQQMEDMGGMGEADLGIDPALLLDMFRDFSVKQWVAKDTYFMVRAVIDMSLEVTAEAMGVPEEEGTVTMDMSMDMLVYDYNQPVSIVLPPEAATAMDISGA